LPLLRGHRAELWSDLRAGIALSLQSLPVALALALAADLAPWRGLVAAAAGGLVAALVGGVPLAVHGPVLALAVLLSAIAERYGLLGLIFAVAGCGALQIGTGVLRLGRFVRLVPLTVVQGFSAGVAVIVLIGQLPSALGLPPPGETHVFRVIEHLGEYVHAAQIAPIGIAAGAALVTGVFARFAPRLPAPLLGLLAATLGALALPVSLPSVASLADGFALLRPAPAAGISAELVGETLAIFAILSAVSLATATNTDRIAVASRHDADQELIGLGLSNVALGLFGALPIAAIASKSARHVERGARTRRAAVSSALALTLVAPLVVVSLAFVPIAALTGVLIALAVRGLELGAVRELWRTGRTELAVLVITALATVLTDLFVGVQAGVLIAVLIAATRVGRSRATVHVAEAEGVHFVALSGPLTFLDAPRFDQVREALARMDVTRGLVLDLRAVPALDSTGAVALGEALLDTLERGGHLAILGARAEVRDALLATPGAEPLLGVERFRREDRPALSPLFDQLADGQQPHTLFITCSDSRVQPNLLTHTDPGELFIVRNIGALVPPSGSSAMLSEPAAIEYAVAVLGVKDVVVCGHSSCGAVRAVFKDKGPPDLENFQHWMASARTIAGDLSSATNVDQAVRRVAQQQLAHLRSYAPVRERVARGELRLHAWFYDLGSAELFEFDTERGDFVRLGERRRSPDAAPSAAAESVA
jgi:carbonic anhydrase